jgi:hypothetical protein
MNCYYCGTILTTKGEPSMPHNIVDACFKCNQKKRILTEDEFRAVLRYQSVTTALKEFSERKPIRLVTLMNYDDHQFLYECGISCDGLT